MRTLSVMIPTTLPKRMKTMAKLYFIYGTMNSSKSTDLLRTAHNYEQQGKHIMVFTSALDSRSGKDTVSSRVGLEHSAVALTPHLLPTELLTTIDLDCILVDEAQFMTFGQVKDLSMIVDTYHIPVLCYGLKNTFDNKLFTGSEALLLYADKIKEVVNVCPCGKKATMNLRLNNGQPVYNGQTIQIGGNESYLAVCRKHYNNPRGILN